MGCSATPPSVPRELRILRDATTDYLWAVRQSAAWAEQTADVNRVRDPERAAQLDRLRDELRAALVDQPGTPGNIALVLAELLGVG